MPRPSNREKLLDCAEDLFAEHGLNGVSLRTIESSAGLSVGSLHYHFGSQEALLEAVLERRLPAQMKRRQELVAELEERRKAVCARDLLDALFRPLVELLAADAEVGRRHVRMMHRLHADGDIGLDFTKTHWPEIVSRVPLLLRKALPHLPKSLIELRFDLTWDSILASLAKWPGGSERDLERYVASVIDYLVGGLEAPAADESS